MTASVRVDKAAVEAALRGMGQHISNTRPLMHAIGVHMRRYVRETITRGGRKVPHAPLSNWTIARTGRTRPLVGLERGVRFRSSDDTTTIFHDSGNPAWHADLHHHGYVIPARIGLMVVPTMAGPIFLRSAKKTKVPAREIWPSVQEVQNEVDYVVARWMAEGRSRIWRA